MIATTDPNPRDGRDEGGLVDTTTDSTTARRHGRAVFHIADLFELVAEAIPDRPALVGGDHRLTYGELDERSNRLANHLIANGLEPGATISIYAWNRTEWVESLFGAYKARAIPINVNYRYLADELRYILDDSKSEALVFERSFAPIVAAVIADLPRLRQLIVLEDGSDEPLDGLPGVVRYEDALADASPERVDIERSPDDLYIMYTGGTTGMPKGVMWRNEDLYFAALSGSAWGQVPISTPEELVERISPADAALRSLVLAPVMHGAAQWGMLITFFGGGHVTLSTARGFDAHASWRLAETERCMTLLVVGDAMARPLAEALDDGAADYDLSSVIAIGSGGAVFSAPVKNQLKAHLPNLFITDSFGATELGAAGSQMDPDAGARFPHNEFMSVLDEHLEPCPVGVVGRLARRGNIPLGYWGDEEKTAATFMTDARGVRWAVPGDFCRLEDDDTITLLGRGSGCINSGGEKIFPEEVEVALKSHPGVFDVLVVGVPDERFTERVAAVVQPRPGHVVTLDDLADHCRTRLARYKAPRELRLVDEIGRTASGKADYRWAKAQFE